MKPEEISLVQVMNIRWNLKRHTDEPEAISLEVNMTNDQPVSMNVPKCCIDEITSVNFPEELLKDSPCVVPAMSLEQDIRWKTTEIPTGIGCPSS
jgi:hypothetical protein